MCRVSRVFLALGVLSLGLTVMGVSAAAASSKDAEGSVTIKFPREDSRAVDLKCGKVDIRSVKIEGAPSSEDVHKARHDKGETSKLRWIFKLDNEGKHTRKVTIKVKVYAEDNDLLVEGDRTDTVSGEKDKDHISVWTEIRTRDYPKANHAHIHAECERED